MKSPKSRTPAPLLGERPYDPAELSNCEADYKNGDKAALAHAIAICACEDVKLPQWVAHAYLHGFNKLREFSAKSWDDILGKPVPKGAHVRAIAKQRQREFFVWAEVQRRCYKGASVDNDMFDDIGKQFHVGRELSKRYYVTVEKRIKRWLAWFPDQTEPAAAIALIREHASALLERCESRSERDRNDARVKLWSLKGRLFALLVRPQ